MDNTTTIKRNAMLNGGSAIKPISIIALVFAAFNFLSSFISYEETGWGYYKSYTLVSAFPPFIELISSLIAISPFILFVLYIFKFFKEQKATVLVPIIFFLFPFGLMFNFFFDLSYYRFTFHGIHSIINLLVCLSFVLAAIYAFNGFKKKALLIIPTASYIASKIYFFIDSLPQIKEYAEESMHIYMLSDIFSLVSTLLIFIALFIFGTKNKIPPIFVPASQIKDVVSNDIKVGLTVKLLSVLALVCAVLYSAFYFVHFLYERSGPFSYYELTCSLVIPSFEYFILIPFILAPFVLFLLYAFKFNKTAKNSILLAIIFGLFSIKVLLSYWFFVNGYLNPYEITYISGNSILYLSKAINRQAILSLLVIISCTVAAISALIGFRKKLTAIITTAVLIVFEIVSFINYLPIIRYYIDDTTYPNLGEGLIFIASILLLVALLLIGLKRKSHALIAISLSISRPQKYSPKRELKHLILKLQLGEIAEEEYLAKRAASIANL